MWCSCVKKTDDLKFIPQKDLFRIDEVAGIFGVHHRTVRRWIDEGKIENVIRTPSMVGVRIKRCELLRLVSYSSGLSELST